jgi:hypothetical protein
MKKVILFLSVMFLCIQIAKTQAPIAGFVFPVNNQSDVELYPTIKIVTNFPIDSSSITFTYPNLDSSIANNPDPPTITLISKMSSDSLADSLYKYIAHQGTYQLLNDTTLLFTPTIDLAPHLEYKIILRNLRCMRPRRPGGGYDTLTIDNTQATFTTIEYVHSITKSIFQYKKFNNCNDTLWVKFNRNLSNPTTHLGNLASIQKYDSTEIINDSTFVRHLSDVSSTSWIYNNDSTYLMIKPNSGFIPGENYILSIKDSYLTGDSSDDRNYNFIIKSHYSIDLSLVSTDSTQLNPDSITTFPRVGMSYFQYNENVKLFAQKYYNNFIFQKWECPGNSLINNNTNNEILLPIACNNLKDLTIKAIYMPYDTITVTVIDSNGIQCKVYNNSGQYLGGAGNYTLAPYGKIKIQALGTIVDTTITEFDNFASTDSKYNLVPNNLITVTNGGYNITVWGDGHVITPGDCEKFACAKVQSEFECDKPDIASISPQSGCISTGTKEQDVQFTCTINPEYQGCYKIGGYSTPTTGMVIYPDNEIHYTVSVTIRSKCNYPYVVFYVSAGIKHHLKVETTLDKTTELEDPDDDTGIGLKRDVTVKIELFDDCGKRQPLGFDGTTFTYAIYTDQDNEPFEIDLPCNYTVKVTALWNLREEGFDFVEWYNGTGYTYPNPNTLITFSFDMKQDRLVKGEFIEHFRLRKVGFYQGDDRNTIHWYNVKEIKNKIIDDIEVYSFNETKDDGFNSKIHFKFNDKVSDQSLHWNIFSEDMTERVDFPDDPSHPGNHYRNTYPLIIFDNIFGRFYNKNNEDGGINKHISYYIQRSNSIGDKIAIPKGEDFLLSIDGNIQNQKGYNLNNPGTYYGETELPGVYWVWKLMRATSTSGDGGLEMETVWQAQILDNKAKGDVETIWQTPENGPKEIDSYMIPGLFYPDYQQYYNIEIIKYPKMKKDYLTTMNWISWDYDNADPNIPETLSKLFKIGVAIALAYSMADTSIHQDSLENPLTPVPYDTTIIALSIMIGAYIGGPLGEIVGYLIGEAIVWFIDSVINNPPDLIGQGNLVYTWQDRWFGAHPSKKKGNPFNSYKFIFYEDRIMQYYQDVELLKKQDGSTDVYRTDNN